MKNTTVQNLWDAAKVVLRPKFTAIQAYLRKQEKSQTINLNLHLNQPEKEQTKPSQQNEKKKKKKTIKIRTERSK